HLEKIETVYGLLGIIKLHAGKYIKDEEIFLSLLDSVLHSGANYFSYTFDITNSLQRQVPEAGVAGCGADGKEAKTPRIVLQADDRFFWNRYLMRRFIDMASRPENDVSRGHSCIAFLCRISVLMSGGLWWNLLLFNSSAALSFPSSTDVSGFIIVSVFDFRGNLLCFSIRVLNPCLLGDIPVVTIRPAVVHHRPFVYALISRRSRYRVGTRYFSRGVDREGNVSNFVETEQIVLADPPDADTGTEGSVEGKLKMSYVQTRGSIPVFWSQVTNLKYAPKLYAVETPQTLHIYGPQTLVNLVNKKGYEKTVGDLFTRVMTEHYPPEKKADHNVTYVHWDFHTECSKMRWDRISLLLEVLDDNFKSQGWVSTSVYAVASGPEAGVSEYYYEIGGVGGQAPVVRSRQNGTTRSNCMDCLDRTNVVQSMIARHVLAKQLREIGVFSPGERVEDDAGLYHMFRNVWADNADAVSSAYSGTSALKTDFTRTGRRTRAGALRDGVNSVVRYLKNNYFDGARQDAFDLFLGNFEVSILPNGAGSPFRVKRTMRYKVVGSFFPLFEVCVCVCVCARACVHACVRVVVETGQMVLNEGSVQGSQVVRAVLGGYFCFGST
ncbi:MAG: SacI homology domain-containing protein, partial [Olpidium bornovanus]